MQLLIDILIRAWDILSITVGVIGILLSLSVLFYPAETRRFSGWLNRRIGGGRWIAGLDRPISIDRWFYGHHRLAGAFLVAGATFVLSVLVFRIGPVALVDPIDEMLLTASIWFGRLAGASGLLIGLWLFWAPGQLARAERKSSDWRDTQSAVNRLDAFHPQMDDAFFHHSILFGIVGLLASALLTVLTIVNLLMPKL